MADKSSTVKINFQFDEKALKNVTGLLKNLTTVMSGLQKQTQSTNRTLDAFMRRIDKLEKSPIVQKGIKIGIVQPSAPKSDPKKAPKKVSTEFTPQGRPPDMLTPNIVDYGKNSLRYKAKIDKEQAEQDKDEQKKLDEEEKKAQLEQIKVLAAVGVGFQLLSTATTELKNAFGTLMQIMNAFGENAGAINSASMTANKYGFGAGETVKYNTFFENSGMGGALEEIADFFMPLRAMAEGDTALAGRNGYGDRMEKLSVLSGAGYEEEVAAIFAAAETGTANAMVEAIMRLNMAATSRGGTAGASVATELGIGTTAGITPELYKSLQDILKEVVVVNTEASAEMATQLAKLDLFWSNLMQEYMPVMVEAITFLNEILRDLKPVIEAFAVMIGNWLKESGLREAYNDWQMRRSQTLARKSHDAEAYFAGGIYEANANRGMLGAADAIGWQQAKNLPESMQEMLSTFMKPGEKPELSLDGVYMLEMLMNQLTTGVDLSDYSGVGFPGIKRTNRINKFNEIAGDFNVETKIDFILSEDYEAK